MRAVAAPKPPNAVKPGSTWTTDAGWTFVPAKETDPLRASVERENRIFDCCYATGL
jgi:hypothetical protein